MSIWKVIVKFVPGTIINDAINDAIKLAKGYHCVVSFNFNGVEMEVNSDDTFDVVYKVWERLSGVKVWKHQPGGGGEDDK